MLFNSYEFIFCFVPFSVALFFILGKKDHRLAILWLVVGSLYFYGWWEWIYIALIIASILFNYCSGELLRPKPNMPHKIRKTILVFGVIFNLVLLAYFKYSNFLIDNLNELLSTNLSVEKIILPLAISFFTFQQITYLVDMYRGEVRGHGFLKYCLFVTFFPQLIAGPIVHHKEILPQFDKEKTWKFCSERFAVGLTFFSIGLFKKIILADGISKYANSTFDQVAAGAVPNFTEAWSGALSYAFQLYFDFSGYADMAIGLACMFGIWLPLNFNSPYKAYNIIEFWRRWHMTLSRFMRDYLYIPMGGGRRGNIHQLRNILLTMLLGGLWHGAGWTFVIWGGLHGLCLVINHLWHNVKKKLGIDLEQRAWWSNWLSRIFTLSIVICLWVVFRAENMGVALTILKSMFGMNYSLEALSSRAEALSGGIQHNTDRLIACLILVWFAPNTQQFMSRFVPESYNVNHKSNLSKIKLQWAPNIYWALFIGILLVSSILNLTRINEFLYFQF